ncbi:MAG: hypothetical protein JSV86_09340 [Gemmatimonadota bacterium]|nr:MAG: hypothetical protein JSV86_09340 [Gemmatimonadota bacterium]
MGRDPRYSAELGALLPALLIALTAAGAAAQEVRETGHEDQSGLGLALLFAMPRGEFANYIDPSLGLGAYLHVDFSEHTPLGLRFDGSMVYYGSQTRHRPLYATGPRGFTAMSQVDVTTRNRIGSFFVGPQLTFQSGAVRPFVHAGVGFSYFWTGTDWEHPYYDDDCDCDEWDEEDCGDDLYDTLDLDLFFEGGTEYDDWTAAWTLGGGVSIALGRSASLYLALQYMDNGRVSYLREGSIIDGPDGYYSFTPIESEADLFVLQFGFSLH